MAANNSNLHKAKTEKNDEFYTQLTDIEKELSHYKQHFKDKVVYCNCDDPTWSNFFKYFQLNFNHLGLKKLISTHFEADGRASYKLEIVSNGQEGNQSTIPDYIQSPLEGNGDFRSEECIELLKEADIVVTNPPFSLFREFIATIEKHGKKYCVLGNVNAITCKEIFPLIRENRMWFGASIHSGDREFRVPDSYPLNAAGCHIDKDGNKFIRVKGVRWFTNLDYKARHEPLTLFKTYNAEEYPQFDYYNVINVNKTNDIPVDYDGVMGVPITFLDKFCPEQFEILNANDFAKDDSVPYQPTGLIKSNGGKIGDKITYARVLIRKKALRKPL